MHNYNLDSIFFMELDNLIYKDPREWISSFKTHDMAYMKDNTNRYASGVCVLKKNTLLDTFLSEAIHYIVNDTEFISEMIFLSKFYEK